MTRLLTLSPLLLASALAHADTDDVRLDLSMGFLAGRRSYGTAAWSWVEGGGRDEAEAREPFAHPPFQDTWVGGPRWEARVVAPPVRMILGYQMPFALYDEPELAEHYRWNDQRHEVVAEGLTAHEIRFGLGLELPTDTVRPYVDLTGDWHLVRTSLSIDGASVTYASSAFSFGARAGVRADLTEHFFVDASGELGIAGPTGYGVQLSVGGSVF